MLSLEFKHELRSDRELDVDHSEQIAHLHEHGSRYHLTLACTVQGTAVGTYATSLSYVSSPGIHWQLEGRHGTQAGSTPFHSYSRGVSVLLRFRLVQVPCLAQAGFNVPA